MAEIIKVPVVSKVSDLETANRIIYFFFGLLEVLLAIRLVFKVTGASLVSGFVSAVYGVTGLFTLPFEGIFRRAVTPDGTAVFEPATLTAIIVYALLAWGIVKLIEVLSGEQQPN